MLVNVNQSGPLNFFRGKILTEDLSLKLNLSRLKIIINHYYDLPIYSNKFKELYQRVQKKKQDY